MVCRKSPRVMLAVVFVITVVIFSSGSILIGMLRYFSNVEDDKWVSRNHLILAGNILQVVAIGGVMGIIGTSGDIGPIQVALILSMLFLFVMIAYLTNYDPADPMTQWISLVLIVIDIYVKLTAILIGYGVCSMDEVPKAVSDLMYGAPKALSMTLGSRR